MNHAVFILSTGRCGTQWIARSLAETYSDLLDVAHEPLHDKYDARTILGSSWFPEAFPDDSPVIAEHVAAIEKRLQTRPYLECGHPSWAAMPILARHFQGRVRIIHLVRHPVPTSYSWLTHGAFELPLLPHLSPKILLSPFDEGVRFPEYREIWDRLSPFEKCLYYWTEVNVFGVDLCSRIEAPTMRIRFEDLFDADGLEQLLEFLDLPPRDKVFEDRSERHDRYHHLAQGWEDWRVIERHPETLAVAKELGYDLDGMDDHALRTRYTGMSF